MDTDYFVQELINSVKEKNKNRLYVAKIISAIWGNLITRFEILLDDSYKLITNYFKDTKYGRTLDYSLATISVRIYLKLEEIIVLIKNGYPDGAMAISRSLHELTVHLLFLIMHKENENLVQRYWDHSIIKTLKELQALKVACESKDEQFDRQADLDELIKKQEELKEQYGKSFIKNDGWAFCIEGIDGFHSMEKSVGGDVVRTFYEMSCSAIHSSPRTNTYSLGNSSEEWILLSGPSFQGLNFPFSSAISSFSAMINGFSDYFKIDRNIVGAYENIILDIDKRIAICLEKATDLSE